MFQQLLWQVELPQLAKELQPPGPKFMHKHSTHVDTCSLIQGGPNTMFFVILWAIYKSKITKTPEYIEQINKINNRVKNDKLCPCFPRFYVGKSLFLSPVLSHRCTHSTDTHSCTHADRNLFVSAAPRFVNKTVLQLKSYMAFLSSEVLEAVQLKDSLLVETLLNTTERHTDAGSYALNLSLSNNYVRLHLQLY